MSTTDTQLELRLDTEGPWNHDIVFENVPTYQLYRELHRRETRAQRAKRIRFPADAYSFLKPWAKKKQEHFLVVCLNGAHEVIGRPQVVSVGLSNRALVHPREIFAPAISKRATAVMIAHNHPSGNLQESNEDREVTHRVKKAGEVLGIPMLDHIVFSATGYFSFLENGEL